MMMVKDKLDVYRSIDDPNILSYALEREEDSEAYITLLVHHAQTYARTNPPLRVFLRNKANLHLQVLLRKMRQFWKGRKLVSTKKLMLYNATDAAIREEGRELNGGQWNGGTRDKIFSFRKDVIPNTCHVGATHGSKNTCWRW
ncbi:hypothetical protein P8452_46413 [Trifolium repens]|nr:hypothetical protein P8452_46413 [Trifolium repens]